MLTTRTVGENALQWAGWMGGDMSFLAIDLGTSFIKGTVLDLDALHLAHIRRVPFPAALPDLPPFHYEVAPSAVVAAMRDLIDTLLPHAPDCAGIVMVT